MVGVFCVFVLCGSHVPFIKSHVLVSGESLPQVVVVLLQTGQLLVQDLERMAGKKIGSNDLHSWILRLFVSLSLSLPVLTAFSLSRKATRCMI